VLRRNLLFCLLAPVLVLGQDVEYPSPERWLRHLHDELLPFWTHPDALGQPAGNFPSVRCDAGSALNRGDPCPEIRNNAWLMPDRQYTVALSRQTYGYGVAFHMTGDPAHLDRMRAGVQFLRSSAMDRESGGFAAWRDNATGRWMPAAEFRNPQELAYALLGIGFYYYLTRDAEVLPDLLASKEYIFRNYDDPELGALRWMLKDTADAKAK
jgi:hypothetical protein